MYIPVENDKEELIVSKLPASALAGGGKKDKRRALDFYPTPPDVTHALMIWLGKHGLIPRYVWEPACGDGAMLKIIEGYSRCIGTDIVSGQNYLQTLAPEGIDAVITNPPFVYADTFIRKAVQEVPLVAMVLKSQYWHSAGRLKLFETTKPSFILPLLWRPDFAGGGNPTMDVMWTVWVKDQKSGTQYELLSKPKVNQLSLW